MSSNQKKWGATEVIITKDGSHTLWLPELQESYHSTHGALQESEHVFIQEGLQYWIQQQTSIGAPIEILEIGLGTGLNALLTYITSLSSKTHVNYTGLEPFPITWQQAQHLNYIDRLAPALDKTTISNVFKKIHQLPSNEAGQVDKYFSLEKVQHTLEEFNAPLDQFDIVYFDAFAPSKQEETWTVDALQKVCNTMKPKTGVLVTYCAQGAFKRTLKEVGMRVEAIPGPVGKREMTRAWRTTP